MATSDIALMGFLPWRDESRDVDVRENPAILAATRAANELGARCVPVAVSEVGIAEAMREVDSPDVQVIVACGQTPTEPRVESFGRVPLESRPAMPDEATPWLLAPDAEEIATRLNELAIANANVAPMRASVDAGGYFCDHLCVELARLSRRREVVTRFVHLTAIDGCDEATREARLAQYTRQLVALARRLSERA